MAHKNCAKSAILLFAVLCMGNASFLGLFGDDDQNGPRPEFGECSHWNADNRYYASYDSDDLIGFHRTVPLGSYVTVYNEFSNRNVSVRIVGNGPIAEGRVMELSPEAFRVAGGQDAVFDCQVFNPFTNYEQGGQGSGFRVPQASALVSQGYGHGNNQGSGYGNGYENVGNRPHVGYGTGSSGVGYGTNLQGGYEYPQIGSGYGSGSVGSGYWTGDVGSGYGTGGVGSGYGTGGVENGYGTGSVGSGYGSGFLGSGSQGHYQRPTVSAGGSVGDLNPGFGAPPVLINNRPYSLESSKKRDNEEIDEGTQ